MGWVGRTGLAAEYACRFAGVYALAWWISAEQGGMIGEQVTAAGSWPRTTPDSATTVAADSRFG